jgi:SRSO17 transposase
MLTQDDTNIGKWLSYIHASSGIRTHDASFRSVEDSTISRPLGSVAIPLHNNNNSIQFFIINVPSQQLQRQLQTQHNVRVDIGNKIKSNTNSITNINSITAN